MIVRRDIYPSEFEFWGQAVSTIKRIEEANKVDEFNEFCEEFFDEIGETQFNDFLSFESDFIFNTLGIEVEDD